MIRKATYDDISAIVQLGCTAFYESAYARRFGYFDTYKVQMGLMRLIVDSDSLVLVSERNGVVDGFVVAGVFDSQFATGRYVSDLALVSRGGSGFALLRRVVAFARERGLPLLMGISSGADTGRVNDLYHRAGLRPVGGLYMG